MQRTISLPLLALALSASLAAPAVADTYTVPYVVDGERYEATLTRDDDGTLSVVDYGNDDLTASQVAEIDDHVATYNDRNTARNDAVEDGTLEDDLDTASADADQRSDEFNETVETSRAEVEAARETGDTETVQAAASDARDSVRSAIENR
ncbi:MAG: hypothetical protein QNJ13_12150 [Paracoccaceae bacterium]|nr:hypothetical protein [Paracoccaceae bacterium]